MKKLVFGLMTLSVVMFTSCSDDDNEEKGGVTAPATYVFERDGSSTVSYGGQTTRLMMANEIASAMKDETKTLTELNTMFADGTGFSNADLDASGKKVRNKVAASNGLFGSNAVATAAIQSKFDGWIADQVSDVFPQWASMASMGTAGYLTESGGSTRYVNAKGLEYNQAFAKSLIGGLVADQILNGYFDASKLDGSNNDYRTKNDAGTLEDGKNYTKMEHHWDEGYGYLYGDEANDVLLLKYLGKVDGDPDFAGIKDEVYNAFKLGRAAIVAKDYDLRDEQADIIRKALSKVIAIRAVHYLQAGKSALSESTVDYASAFHDLSEGYGFVFSLAFTHNPDTDMPYFTAAEVQGFIAQLDAGNGFWDVTPATLDSISDAIAAEFDFTVDQA